MIKVLKEFFSKVVGVVVSCFKCKDKNVKCDIFEKEDWYHDVGVYFPPERK